jgi:transposase-like protein
VIVVAIRWYLRYGLSYRDVEELLAERGIEVDHVTVFRWVQRFTPLLADAARFCRHAPGDRWFTDETYVKVNGVWRYVYRAVDQHGQVIDVLVSARRDGEAARRFFQRALASLKVVPAEVVTDSASVYPAVLDELIPSAWHHVRTLCQHPCRIRSRPAQATAPTDATASYRSDRASDHRRARFRAEPTPWPLRTRHRRPGPGAGQRGVHRARQSDLTTADRGSPCPALA